jgi:hypothetical protein
MRTIVVVSLMTAPALAGDKPAQMLLMSGAGHLTPTAIRPHHVTPGVDSQELALAGRASRSRSHSHG